MTFDDLTRGIRKKKEEYILKLVQNEGKIRATELYGLFTKRFYGCSIRTFMQEYLPALEYRGEIKTEVDGVGFFVLDPKVWETQAIKKGEIPR